MLGACASAPPLAYHMTTGRRGPCVWSDWPTEGRDRDKPIPCGCKTYVEAEGEAAA